MPAVLEAHALTKDARLAKPGDGVLPKPPLEKAINQSWFGGSQVVRDFLPRKTQQKSLVGHVASCFAAPQQE